jgi:hypothetical protein
MSSIDTAIGARLAGYAGLSALVSTRIYHDEAKQNGVIPYVTFICVDDLPIHSMGTMHSLRDTRYQVDCWASSKSEARAIAVQVELALDNYSGTSDSVSIANSLSEGIDPFPYDPAEGCHRCKVEFLIQYVRT